MGTFKHLTAPLHYLRICHPDKIWMDWGVPIALALMVCAVVGFSPIPIPIFGSKGLIQICTDVLQLLTGFYVTALAAVATLNRPGLDDLMAGEPATLNGKDLTRRKFVCYLFGFLAFSSLALYFTGAIANLIAEPTSFLMPQDVYPSFRFVTKWVFAFIYALFVAQLIVAGLLGLWYLTTRLHEPDPRPPQLIK